MRKHWNRWIYNSISTYFSVFADANSLYLYIAGRSDEKDKHDEFIELRISHVITSEISKNYYKINVNIDVLYSTHLIPEDGYRAQKIAGLIEYAITDICVYKYGNGSDDDDTLLGTLQLQDSVESNYFGQIRPDTRLLQGVTSASLQMTIKT